MTEPTEFAWPSTRACCTPICPKTNGLSLNKFVFFDAICVLFRPGSCLSQDKRYLTQHIREIEQENAEREAFDTSNVVKPSRH